MCRQQSTFCHEALGTHIPHASHDCHALRYHNGAHGGGGVPMPPNTLGAENCVVCHFGRLLCKFRGALTAVVANIHLEWQSPSRSRHTPTPCLTKLPRPGISQRSTRWRCSDASQCPQRRELRFGIVSGGSCGAVFFFFVRSAPTAVVYFQVIPV